MVPEDGRERTGALRLVEVARECEIAVLEGDVPLAGARGRLRGRGRACGRSEDGGDERSPSWPQIRHPRSRPHKEFLVGPETRSEFYAVTTSAGMTSGCFAGLNRMPKSRNTAKA